MKTALTELLEDLKAMKNSEVLGIAKDAIHECIITATSYLETEKQQHAQTATHITNVLMDALDNPKGGKFSVEYEFNKYWEREYGSTNKETLK